MSSDDIKSQLEQHGAKGAVMVVEDDHVFRSLIAKNLERRGLTVREAENGLIAKTIFDIDPSKFCLIISDVRMPEMDGVALLKYIRAKSEIPFIVMTGFSELIEAKNAYDLGANEFLPKPVKSDALLEAIVRCFNPKPRETKSETAPAKNEDYCQIHVDEFVSTTHLRSDIFLKLGDRFIKVAHIGEAVPLDRLKKYQASNVEYLFVRLEDFRNYVNFSIQVSNVISQSNTMGKEAKLKVLKHTAEVITESCFRDGISRAMFDPASKVVLDTVNLVSEDQDILTTLANMDSGANRMYVHSVAVSVFATMIAKGVGWNSITTQFKVSLAGLFHDMGKKEIPTEVLDKKRIHLSAEESKFIESHVLRGRDILRQLAGVPEDVAEVAYQHHENYDGTGYPQRLKGEHIHPIARVIRLADLFVNCILPMEEEARLTPQEALAKITKNYAREIDPNFIKGLAKAIGSQAEPPVGKAG